MFFAFAGVVVVLGVAWLVAYAGMFWRDKALDAKENLALWSMVSFAEMEAENCDLYLILPVYGRLGVYEVKKGGDEMLGFVNANRVPAELTFGPRTTLVHLPVTGSRDLHSRTADDSVVFWSGEIIEGEILPMVKRGGGRRYALVTDGREYEVSIPGGSERGLGAVVIDDVTVAEFARADRLSIGRARLLAVNRGEPLEMLPFFVWLAIFR